MRELIVKRNLERARSMFGILHEKDELWVRKHFSEDGTVYYPGGFAKDIFIADDFPQRAFNKLHRIANRHWSTQQFTDKDGKA